MKKSVLIALAVALLSSCQSQEDIDELRVSGMYAPKAKSIMAQIEELPQNSFPRLLVEQMIERENTGSTTPIHIMYMDDEFSVLDEYQYTAYTVLSTLLAGPRDSTVNSNPVDSARVDIGWGGATEGGSLEVNPDISIEVNDGSGSDGTTTEAPPTGPGWQKKGSGKGKLSAFNVAKQIANSLQKGKNYEIYIDYKKDGSFDVWVREVKG